MIKENRASKYLLYAIGEIVLVVIGILIALQINNWNETKKERQLEYSYLVLLNKDLQSDAIILKDLLRYSEQAVKSKAIILEYQQNEGMLTDSLSHHFLQAVFNGIPSFVPNTGAIEEIQNAGGLTLLQDETVRNQILELYNQYHFLEKNVEQYYLENRLAMRNLVFSKADGNLFLNNGNLDKTLLNILLEDNELRNRLLNNWAISYNNTLYELMEINARTIAVCKNYLKDFDH